MQKNKTLKYIVTGGAGFIGSALVRLLIQLKHQVINIDKLTYAGNLESLECISKDDSYTFEKADICNQEEMDRIFHHHQPDKVIHLAAESHVDRSIKNPDIFIKTNVLGTHSILESATSYYNSLKLSEPQKASCFLFHHVSTDEVYGDLGETRGLFTENTPYAPSSPYSASKAASDHLVRAWNRTYNLPVVITNCSNNYGPYQYPEKLIPLIIISAISGNVLPIYGDGMQIRDWLYVEDHAKALVQVATNGQNGETYNIGGNNEYTNRDVVHIICKILDEKLPNHPEGITEYKELIQYVDDRLGHDQRYAIDSSKIQNELGWESKETFESGIEKTINWYLNNLDWVKIIQNKAKKES
tara:strand:+ start:1202 stop:2272 length:1071 start_codon:yes stop_codon:yes gene_type:complete